jgi:hypothetical protein
MSTPVKNTTDHAILCPHLKFNESGDSIEGITVNTASIELSGEKTLLLCGPCWNNVRAHAYDEIVRLAVRHR